MTSKLFDTTAMSKESKMSEYKSPAGIVFKAKLIGNVEVDELRGKTVAENAMAKLKFDLLKKRQHKTRINITLKWDGLYVSLSEGGQELLHNFDLEQISFVWKDSTDDRAVGIIITEISADKQSPMIKFYAYKTEKPAIPLIMALKELFLIRTSEESEVNHVSPSKLQESEIEAVKSSQDLLDLNFSSHKPDVAEEFSTENINENQFSNWSTFSNNNCQNYITPVVPPGSTMIQMSNVVNNTQTPWITYPKISNVLPSPFHMPWPGYSCFENNTLNPFVQPNITEKPIRGSAPLQTNNPQLNTKISFSQSQNANHQTTDLFSDLVLSNYGLDCSKNNSKSSFNSNENEMKKISLVDIKNSQIQKELKMDFSILDNGNSRPPVKQKINASNSLSTPLFQVD